MSWHRSVGLRLGAWCIIISASTVLIPTSRLLAAVVTNGFVEDFGDTTIVPQLTTNGTPTISNGFADLDGNNTAGAAQGYYMDITSINAADGGNGPDGGGPAASWIMEAVIGPDSIAGSDGIGAAPSSNDVLFSFNGRYGLRFATATNWSLFSRVAAGTADVNSGIPNGADRPIAGAHIAIVFTDNGTTDTLDYYKNGVLAHTITGDFNRSNINRAGFGLEINTGASLARGFNGTFDAIAFSTFTGVFNPNGGDSFALPVPEPALLPAALCLAAPLAGRVRRH